jgi:indolepyruvate ferredoxin oxidoreductase alpha subunit
VINKLFKALLKLLIGEIFINPNCLLKSMKEFLSNQAGKKIILMGNEAVARGALEAGMQFASVYPGTPSSEVGDTFFHVAKEAGIYFEYANNEKVATESAAGAAFSGLRSMTIMKHFGLNVAVDCVAPIAWVGPRASYVINVADDPNNWSSAQSEQDTRHYGRMLLIPIIEPSTPQEAKDLTKFSFETSEKYETPIFLRTTTRVSHARGVVKLGKLKKLKRKAKFPKDYDYFYNLPPKIVKMHAERLELMDKMRREVSEKTKHNYLINANAKSDTGIIVSGAALNYLLEALKELNFKVPILKLGVTYPFPKDKVAKFIKRFKRVIVMEELDPVMETDVKLTALDKHPKLKIHGKDVFPNNGEFTTCKTIQILAKLFKKKFDFNFKAHAKKYAGVKVTKRFATFCPGCPHRASFWAVKKAVPKETIFGGDIGCYIMGMLPPYFTQDFEFSMSSVMGIVHGLKKATNNKQKALAFVGDSTFFHSSVTGLITMVTNKSNALVVVMDNRFTAMTGQQPNPGTGLTGMKETVEGLKIEDIAKACGVKDVRVVNAYNIANVTKTVKQMFSTNQLGVLVIKGDCRLAFMRNVRRRGLKIPKFEIDQNKCIKCGICLKQFACPAIRLEKNTYWIDRHYCWGCSACSQVCPVQAIHPITEKGKKL